MYHPKTSDELFDILSSLQHYAELHGFEALSEKLTDARMVYAMDKKTGEEETARYAGQPKDKG